MELDTSKVWFQFFLSGTLRDDNGGTTRTIHSSKVDVTHFIDMPNGTPEEDVAIVAELERLLKTVYTELTKAHKPK